MAKCLQINTDYGPQFVIIDEGDTDLVRQVTAKLESQRLCFIVQPEGAAKRIGLHQAVALRHVRKPSPAHKYVGFRNRFQNDFRAHNLYWQTAAEARGRRMVAFRQDKMFELSNMEQKRRAVTGAPA